MNLNLMIAVCGMDCESCDIRRAPEDSEAAQRLVQWFRNEGWLKEGEGIEEIVKRSMYCRGCRGDRSIHWSPDCWILTCCVEEKGHQFCSQCEDFPCTRLTEHACQRELYQHALNRLKAMRDQEKR